MFRKSLALFLAFVLMFSMCTTTAFGQPIDASQPQTSGQAVTGSDRDSEYDSFQRPDMSNPYGAEGNSQEAKLPETKENQLLGKKGLSVENEATVDDQEIIRDREGNMTVEEFEGSKITPENPFGAVYSLEEIVDLENTDEQGIEQQRLSSSAMFMQRIGEEVPGTKAKEHLIYFSDVIGGRVADAVAETVYEEDARDYIFDEFESYGYTSTLQPFETYKTLKDGTVVGAVYSSNVIAVKPGLSDQVVIVGAHYDSVTVNGSTGTDDNASGVSVMLEAAEKISQIDTPYTIKFVAFGAEEKGLLGSKYYVSKMTEEDIANTVAMVNLDSVAAGDFIYVYGGAEESSWVREKTLDIAKNLGIPLRTSPGLAPKYPYGTTGNWSDHSPFESKRIPFIYFESTNWDIDPEGGWAQVDNPTIPYGEIMHSKYDKISEIERLFPGRIDHHLNAYTQVLAKLLLDLGKIEYKGMLVSNNLVSMTEARVVDVSANFGYVPNLSDVQWTYGGVPFEEWKKFNYKAGQFTGDPFITFEQEPYLEGNTIKAKIKFDMPFDTNNLQSRNIRVRYPELLGTYDFAAADNAKGMIVSTPMKLNAYDSFHTWDEAIQEIYNVVDDVKANVSNRYIEYKSLGDTVNGRETPFVILAKDQASVDKYLNETLPMALNNPAELQERIDAGEDVKIPVWFNNIHPDEAPGIDAILDVLKKFAYQDSVVYDTARSKKGEIVYDEGTADEYIQKVSKEVDGTVESVELDIDKALDNLIFLFNFSVNPDGRVVNTRTNANGFDINRDCAFQTQPEAVNVTAEIAKWSPTNFLDFHGFVAEFLIEPTTAPHDPNYEYDLLLDNMVEQAHIMGRAGIGSTNYTNYLVPREDYKQGWDDASPVYTPMYAMHHGALGHTIEIPALNEESTKALIATALSSTKYMMDNKDRLYEKQLEYFRRGIENIDAKDTVDPLLVGLDGESIGRPRVGDENYFPEYYVIPSDSANQKNVLEAYKMAEYLIRNGVKVERSNATVTVGDKTYPAGSFIVNMHQAKRGYANVVLSDGFDVSMFEEMYAEIVINFQDLRGFDRDIIRQVGAFEGKTENVDSVNMPNTLMPNESNEYIIKNVNNDAIKAVNRLLDNGKTVKMTMSSGKGYVAGDFVVSKNDLYNIKNNYYLELAAFDNGSLTKEITKPSIGLIGTGHIKFLLDELGFDIAPTYSEGNVIVSTSSTNVKTLIEAGKPYVGIGGSPIRFIRDKGILPGIDYGVTYSYYEGLLRGTTAQDSLITANYKADELIYDPNGTYFKSVPEGVKVLTRVVDSDDYFKAGWWPGSEEVKGMATAVTAKAGNTNVTLFANNIANKAHAQHYYRMLANAIYSSMMDTDGLYQSMSLSNNLVSMTEKRVIDIEAEFDQVPTLENLEWTFGGKPLSEWKKYDFTKKTYTGAPFVSLFDQPTIEGNTVKAKIQFDLPYNTTDLSGSARSLYPNLIGKFDLVLKDKASNAIAKSEIKINAYDSYHTYDELKPAIDEIMLNAKDNRYIEYKSLGKSTEGRDAHFVILAKNRKAVDKYLNEILPLAKKNPAELQRRIADGTIGDYKVPIFFNNIHPNEAPGIDAIIKLFEQFATEDTLSYKDYSSSKKAIDKNGIIAVNNEDTTTEKVVTINVDEALDNIIFLFNFTENPDGRFYNVRGNVNGFDINRDNAYQTQVESRMTIAEIAKWTPISMLDFHGHVKDFLIEPCTTPHEPNYEYDLLIKNMLEQAHLMGRAGVANTKYDHYLIPYEDYTGGWDDGAPSYTATYAMYHGAMAHTVEMPDINEDSLNATYFTGLASTNYVLKNKDRLYDDQLEIFRRGVENIDSREVDKYMLNAAGEQIGRPRGNNINFFPEYYVLPTDKSLQKNALEVYNMVQYLIRNDIEIEKTTQAVVVGDKTYPVGSFVVPMHQAKRSYANTVLYDGFDASGFDEMYAELIMAFPDTRGFDRYIMRDKGVFDGKTEGVTSVATPSTQITADASYYVIKNSNNDAVRAVNQLLNNNKKVELILNSGTGYEMGDYLVSKTDMSFVKNDYLLDVLAYSGNASTKVLAQPKIQGLAAGHLKFVLDELGFNMVTADSNIIVSNSTTNVKTDILGGKPYIGIGGNAMSFIKNSGLLPGFDYKTTYYEGLLRGTVDKSSLIGSGYKTEEVMYDAQGAYIINAGGAKVVTSVVDRDDYFKAGWWTGNEVVRGKALAVTQRVGNTDVTVFANNIVNKAHPQHSYRMLANAIFASLSSASNTESFTISLENTPNTFKLGKDANVNVKINNTTTKSQSATLIVALYDKNNNRMDRYVASTGMIESGKEVSLNAVISLPASGNYLVKAFVWDDLINARALSDSKEIQVVQ